MREDRVMALRIAGLPVWGPSDVIAGARAALGWTDDAVAVVEALVARDDEVATHVEALVLHAEGWSPAPARSPTVPRSSSRARARSRSRPTRS